MERKTVSGSENITKAETKIVSTFYSNSFTVAKTQTEAYIEFLQQPPQNNVVPAIRIYMSSQNLEMLEKLLIDLKQKDLNIK